MCRIATGKKNKAMARLQRKARAIDDLLYSATNHVAVKEELGQYSDIFKLLSTYHEEYCELVDAGDQKHQVNWFDDLDQDVFNFKHKIHNWLKESDNKSSRLSSRGSSRSKKSSGSTGSSGSSNPQGLDCTKITHIFSLGPALKMRLNMMK